MDSPRDFVARQSLLNRYAVLADENEPTDLIAPRFVEPPHPGTHPSQSPRSRTPTSTPLTSSVPRLHYCAASCFFTSRIHTRSHCTRTNSCFALVTWRHTPPLHLCPSCSCVSAELHPPASNLYGTSPSNLCYCRCWSSTPNPLTPVTHHITSVRQAYSSLDNRKFWMVESLPFDSNTNPALASSWFTTSLRRSVEDIINQADPFTGSCTPT